MKKEVFLIAISASIALGANNQKDLDLINASAAYAQGITGSGIKIGVIDGPARDDVSLLQGKVKDQMFSKYKGSTYKPDYTVDTHGTHVTSIIVGNNLGNNAPHGVAYGATSYNLQVTGRNTTGSNSAFEVPSSDEIYSYFMNNGVSVINNSWNSKLYPLIAMNEMNYYPSYLSAEAGYWISKAFESKEMKSLAKISEENKALVVFAAGNEGMSSPGIFATLPSYNEKLRSFLVVGAVDSDKITKNGDELELKGVSVPLFSNGFKGAINYALMAPGNNVLAANSAYLVPDYVLGKIDKNEFIKISGTSQATPYVSGAAALVQEKFPFLKPNQVADVLLSTANQNFKKPKAIVKKTTGRGLNDSQTAVEDKTYYTVFYLDEIPMKGDQVDKAQVEKDLQAEGYTWREYWVAVQASNINQFKDPEGYNWIQKVSWQEVFGQGILDIEKALNGLGRLDANRMGDDYIDPNNEKQALYPLEIDKSHDEVVFSNDISERLWDKDTHIADAQNRPQKIPSVTQIGIKKTGDGSLTLSGQNTYKGDTIVSEGSLKLTGSITSDVKIANEAKFILGDSAKSSAATITGNVLNNGVFAGIGVIKGDFDNKGTVMAGFYDYVSPITDGSKLEVTGTYKQSSDAKLQIAFSSDDSGSANTKFKAGNFEIASGAKLEFVPIHTAQKLITTGIINIKNDSSM